MKQVFRKPSNPIKIVVTSCRLKLLNHYSNNEFQKQNRSSLQTTHKLFSMNKMQINQMCLAVLKGNFEVLY
jgi:hypothetical protein